VLIEGETGTGKELAAEGLHDEGPRTAGPLVVFDCSAVSASLIESELFGHVRGAFTGAVGDRAGAFEQADGGTLFLDEIGELPLDLQPKLLRALERREIRRVGGNQSRRVDVRIIAATNRSLVREVERGRFREDLYYRLAVIAVKLPPLRERAEDIPPLIEQFLRELGARPAPPAHLLTALAHQSFPGNVRELKNAVARLVSLAGGQPGEGPAPAVAPSTAESFDPGVPLRVAKERMIDAFERTYLEAALARTGGNISRAAELAGVSRKFVQRAVREHGLKPTG
jgi:transcriptional regulator with GAF, ATPase, and Fis domain